MFISSPSVSTVVPEVSRSVARNRFAAWLTSNAKARRLGVPAMLKLYGRSISYSAAYRVLVDMGLRGQRNNRSRYERFWQQVNWRLPDIVLSAVWGTWRGNLRSRRLRIKAPAPRWQLTVDRKNPGYQRALAREQAKAAAFTGSRPV